MNCRNQKGFTLIEVIVVAGIIAILAGILVPTIFGQIDESKKTRALGECKIIQTAVMTFRKDVGKWPYYTDATSVPPIPATILYTGASAPAFNYYLDPGRGFSVENPTSLAEQLVTNTRGYDAKLWKGPYMTDTLDPWGNAYVINTNNFAIPTEPIWVISGGPDGIVQSDPRSTGICMDSENAPNTPITPCDDIGVRIQ